MPEVVAPAKLTLSLRVTGVRADGYHELESVMVTVTEPHDIVTIVPAETMSLDGRPARSPTACRADPSNLAWRAADALRRDASRSRSTKASRMVPGSAADRPTPRRCCVALGADPDARGDARGRRAVLHAGRRGARPRDRRGSRTDRGAGAQRRDRDSAFACSTADVYRAWDALGGPHAEPNDLEPAAHHVEPRLAAFKAAVEAAAGARRDPRGERLVVCGAVR